MTVTAPPPRLANVPPERHQVAVELAVELAYERGRRDGYRAGLDAGLSVTWRVQADQLRRLDDARTGEYRSAGAVRDDRLVDALRAQGILPGSAA